MTARSILARTAAAVVGLIGWSATEYVAHRWVMHGPFGRGRLRHIPLGGLHRAHHRDPLATSLPARAAGHTAIAAVAGSASIALGTVVTPSVARVGAAAWSLGYSTYEIAHWNAHHRPARSNWGRRLRARHHRHHFGAPASNLGVTNAVWDRLLGTEADTRPATEALTEALSDPVQFAPE